MAVTQENSSRYCSRLVHTPDGQPDFANSRILTTWIIGQTPQCVCTRVHTCPSGDHVARVITGLNPPSSPTSTQ